MQKSNKLITTIICLGMVAYGYYFYINSTYQGKFANREYLYTVTSDKTADDLKEESIELLQKNIVVNEVYNDSGSNISYKYVDPSYNAKKKLITAGEDLKTHKTMNNITVIDMDHIKYNNKVFVYMGKVKESQLKN